MAKRERPPITVKAYVKVNGVETDVDTLNEEQRRRLGTAIKVTMLNELFWDGHCTPVELAQIGQYAENVYFGKPSGLMDQLTISRGDVSFMNFGTEIPTAETADWHFDDTSLVIINCGGDHCNLTGEYSAIRSEMESVAAYFDKKVLGDVDEEKFFAAIPDLRKKFSGRAVLRAIHFFEENRRVKQTEKAILNGDKAAFLKNITESGLSSYMLLQNCYPAGDVNQPVSLALAIAARHKDTLACRVHGGGFAGTILTFVDTVNSVSYVEEIANVFGKENVFCIKIRKLGATEIEL